MMDSSPHTAQLPPEITDIVIDFCHDQMKTLLSSSLVSRDWLRSSRRHLFGEFWVRKESQIPRLLTLLHSPHQTISPAIEVVRLDVSGIPESNRLASSLALHGATPFGLDLEVMNSMGSFLSDQNHLHITFPHITSLTIKISTSVSPEILNCIASFTELTHLKIVVYYTSPVVSDGIFLKLAELRSLTVHGQPANLLRWFTLQPMLSVTSFNLSLGDRRKNASTEELESAIQFLDFQRHSLEHLTFHLDQPVTDVLPLFPRLTTVTLRSVRFDGRILSSLLRSLNAPVLETLTIRYLLDDDVSTWSDTPWEELQSLLTSDKFGRLKTLALRSNAGLADDCLEYCRRGLSQLSGRVEVLVDRSNCVPSLMRLH